jgi:hypothetical protein
VSGSNSRCFKVGLLLVAPALLGAQSTERQAWFTTYGEIRATKDGWVEWRIAPPVALPPHRDNYPTSVTRFEPAAARAWAEAARRALFAVEPAPRTTVPRLRAAGASISLTVHRDSQGVRNDLLAGTCWSGTSGGAASLGDVLLLVNAMADAARVASLLKPTPAVDQSAGPFSEPEVACAATLQRGYMPAWSPDYGPRPASRGETLVRFIVTEEGRVDSTTLVWDHTPSPPAARAARVTLADWQFVPARLDGRRVRQWSHAQLWFADSMDAAEWQLAGRAPPRSFAARRDGRIEHAYLFPFPSLPLKPTEALHIREAFTPAAVRAWWDPQSTPDTRGVDLVTAGGFSRRAGGAYDGCPRIRPTLTGRIADSAWTSLADSVRIAIDEAERRPLVPIDSTRVHGETEVTCPAYPRGELASPLTRSPNAEEVVLSFIVGRDGRVDPSSATVLGDITARETSAIRATLAAQRWEPGRLAGVRVPQRAHLVLFPVADPVPGLATEACVQASTVAVRLRVREPEQGIASTDLTRIAHVFSQRLSLRAPGSATDGTFALVLDDAGGAHFFSWKRPPADSAAARAAEYAFGGAFNRYERGTGISSVPSAPVAVEGDLLPACP